ncbi:hypothetical protein JN086_10970 [Mycolicibacterium austroafricanum]|uniref:Secreted protein n=1 Tax=Mycolicibacterium austroafricanum TaxID=39687 RepID=A0ABT8HLI3_MYCAO|nr:hypothetical protein [Mycolicibacterium austroafricanum]MDN4521628.1 hypothetical protein [Mycolicibacterium austroafricanum]QRZ09339.1 hypothetical protein JN090_13040 [Mycolicibacterium austroafricanum]QZT70457.1 hypothetical protein JN086_10970 [Mycolicibacterium austroafricanum]
MTTTLRARSASVAAGLLLASFMAAPVAHADVLADLRGTVTADRLKYGPSCPPLRYNNVLQDIGFAQGQFVPDTAKSQGMIASYPGEVRSFIGVGDPMAAARTNAYEKGAGSLIGNCAWTEYGVSFIRYEPTETDWVGIVFGKPSGVTTPPSGPGTPGGGQDPAPAGTPAPPQMKACPPGGLKPEVPAGEQCPAPANAVRVSFVRAPFQWTVNVKNNAGIGGSCSYDARSTSGATGASREFDIDPNGSTTFQVPAPLPFTTYHVVTSCTGSYDGRQVEFGHDEQDVSL